MVGKDHRRCIRSCFKGLLATAFGVLCVFYVIDLFPPNISGQSGSKDGSTSSAVSLMSLFLFSSPPYPKPLPAKPVMQTSTKTPVMAGDAVTATTIVNGNAMIGSLTNHTSPVSQERTAVSGRGLSAGGIVLTDSGRSVTTRGFSLSTTKERLRTGTSGGGGQFQGAYPRQYQFLLNEPPLCQVKKPFLVLMVPVHPGNFKARRAIRSTWGNETLVQGKVVLTLFLVGMLHPDAQMLQRQVDTESMTHHDIVQSSFLDTYQNLTIKTMVIMDWLAVHCPSASYAMKVDSDMFLNVENLITMLATPQTPTENYITGMVMWNRPVVRDPQSKWYVPEDQYPDAQYPTYLLGMGYVFSNDLPEKLVGASRSVKAFNIEDAYVGACIKHLGLEPSSPPDPSQFKAYASGPFKYCDYAHVITTILHTSSMLLEYWQEYKKGGSPC